MFRSVSFIFSAVGYAAGEQFLKDRGSSKIPLVALATAHIAKFVEVSVDSHIVYGVVIVCVQPLQASYREKGGASPELMRALSSCMPRELERL